MIDGGWNKVYDLGNPQIGSSSRMNRLNTRLETELQGEIYFAFIYRLILIEKPNNKKESINFETLYTYSFDPKSCNVKS